MKYLRFLLHCVAIFSVVWLCGLARADSITIGSLTYVGTENGVSGYQLSINTNGITMLPLSFSSVILSVKGISQNAGPNTTPTFLLFTGGSDRALPACPCNTILLELVLKSANPQMTFSLANGQTFTTSTKIYIDLRSRFGKLTPGQSVPITLMAVPEPSGFVLLGGGVLSLLLFFLTCHGWRTATVLLSRS